MTGTAVRREKLAGQFAGLRIDAMLVTELSNIRYLSGFSGSNANLLLASGRALLFTDPRYQTQAPLESDCEVRIAKGPLAKTVALWLKRLRLRRVGFEWNRIGFREQRQLAELAPAARWKPVASAIESLRTLKSQEEIRRIRASVALNSKAYEEALRHFRHGMSEVELAAEIDYRMRRLGADGTAFDTIVASGPRTALPHAHPSGSPIQSHQLLLVDMGARVAGYCSDMTRTCGIGKLNTSARRMYRAVLESQLAALDAVKPGVACAAVDGAARSVLRRHGLERAFVHSTGHGLGLEIHEGPRIGRKEKTKLQAGMAITIEPGAYLEGVGGVRIEDTVLVTETGCEILTPTSKELLTV